MTDPTTTPSPDETRREAVDQPDGICAESVDDLRVPSPAKAAERVEAFVRWFGDGRVVIDYDLAAEDDDPPLYARDLNALTCAVQHGYRADAPSRCMHTATAVDDRRQAPATLLGEMFEGGVLWSDVDAILALASRPAPVVSGWLVREARVLAADAWDEGWDASIAAYEQCPVTGGLGPCGAEPLPHDGRGRGEGGGMSELASNYLASSGSQGEPFRNQADAPCPTCSGPVRETVGMVCQTCGTDYAAQDGAR
jgi:hypothetical protein